MPRLLDDILKLSVSDRIEIAEAIWESIGADNENVAVSNSTKNLLQDRLKSFEKDKAKGESWDAVKSDILKK